MTEIREFEIDDMVEVGQNPNDPWFKPTMARTGLDVRKLAEFYKAAGPAFTVLLDGEIVGCGGINILWHGVGEAWLLPVADKKKLWLIDPAIAKKKLYELIEEYKLVRVQAPPKADWKPGIQYLEWLGFEKEKDGILRKYHPDGSDCIMYSIVRGD